ncbi:hypothetical protein PIB30_094051 [Stylosanthes scabra]|uniref:DUF4283 domain-containing protein n=1 Tax=Stylosanthes scabra TaxID=79078 RepID=A0ABU6WTL7_9FABA|nr:hypothetical protein [Stylosanthes scabra]
MQSSFLLSYSREIRVWSERETNVSRTVWIATFSLPLHAWNEENYFSVAECWGKVVKRGENIIDVRNFTSAKAKEVLEEIRLGQQDGTKKGVEIKKVKQSEDGQYKREDVSTSNSECPTDLEETLTKYRMCIAKG